MGRCEARIGQVVGGRWRIDALLNNGPMSAVYAATDTTTGSRVALKILNDELAVDDSMRKRFQREGFASNAVDHPGVVRVFAESIAEGGEPVLVMDLLDGESLEAIWQRAGGKMPASVVVEIARRLLDILAAAHARGVVHRDIKPSNVFITRTGEVKLLDFGLAWDSGRGEQITGVGVVMGTPAFMPPEQALARREDIDARTDLWSLGATVFALLSGRAVHAHDSIQAQMVACVTTPATPLREVAPHVPAPIAAVIDRALAFERIDRWDDADAMSRAFRLATTTTPGSAPIARIDLVAPRSAAVLAIAACAIVLAALAGGERLLAGTVTASIARTR